MSAVECMKPFKRKPLSVRAVQFVPEDPAPCFRVSVTPTGTYGHAEDERGYPMILEPGQWLIEVDGKIVGCTDELFQRFYEPA